MSSARDSSRRVKTDKMKGASEVKGASGVRTGTGDETQKVKKTRRERAADRPSRDVKVEKRRERGREGRVASTSTLHGSEEVVPATAVFARNDDAYGRTDRNMDRKVERWTDRERGREMDRERRKESSVSSAIGSSREFNSHPNIGDRKTQFTSWDRGPNSTISKSTGTPPGPQIPPFSFPPFPLPQSYMPPLTTEKHERKISVKMDREPDSTLLLKSEISQAPVSTAWNATAVTKKWSTTF